MSSFDLTARVAQGLESGDLRAIDVERMLDRSRRRGRFRLPSLFAAVGLLTVVSGLAFLYIAGYHSLTLTERRYTPFAFPAMLMGVAILLDRLRRPRWQVELAAMVADVATALAFIGASRGVGRWSELRRRRRRHLARAVDRHLPAAAAGSADRLGSLRLVDRADHVRQPARTPSSDLAGTFLVEAAAAAIVGLALIKSAPGGRHSGAVRRHPDRVSGRAGGNLLGDTLFVDGSGRVDVVGRAPDDDADRVRRGRGAGAERTAVAGVDGIAAVSGHRRSTPRTTAATGPW